MSNFSAIIPAALTDAANAHLEALGFGPRNFSVPVRTGTGDATHTALHSWDIPDFRAAVEAMVATYPGLKITYGTGEPNFDKMCQAEKVEWIQPTGSTDSKMKGEQVAVDGRTWESLIDYNVWKPGVSGWREIVSVGYPTWVQPTGAHDAYALGSKVSFQGTNYESVINANVWSPTVYPAGWKTIA